jgi:hypothetical protein
VRSAGRRWREVRCGGRPRRRTGAAGLTSAEAVKRGRAAPVAWRKQATTASARRSDSTVGVVLSDTGPVGIGTGGGGFGPGERARRGGQRRVKARRGTGTWQPCGNGALAGGPGAGSGS